MSNEKWVQNMIWAVVFLNMVVLCRVFVIPRAHFMVNHFQDRRETLNETSAPLDMPNQYTQTYQMMNRIREIADEDSFLLFPPDNWEFGSPRSAVVQTLYPRRVYFFGDKDFDKLVAQAFNIKKSYVVFNGQWGKSLCKKRSVTLLGVRGFGICRIGKE